MGHLEELNHLKDDNPLAFYRFEYDDANRLTQFESVDGSSTYDYNERDELTSTDHSYEAYGYDETGNRTNTGYETGEQNRLLNDGTFSYTYDNEGNRETRTETATGVVDEYVWDYGDRLTSITTKDSSGAIIKAVEYTYDVYDRRIRKVVDLDGDGVEAATTENFVYDGDHIALVFDENENLIHRYLHGPNIDQVLAEETADGEVRWALTDHQGSVRDVIDNDGVILNHITYDSFGNITSETDSEVSFRFGYTGREFDEESGQYFYRARYYDPTVGRFTNEDTIGFAGSDTNLFRYVGNSPLIYIDPSGNNRIGTAWNWVGDRINDTISSPAVYNVLDKYDEFSSGVASASTGGLTDRLRSRVYGDIATQNHQGGYRIAGEITGTVAITIVSGSGGTAAKLANGVDKAATVIDTGEAVYNIATGCGDAGDLLTLGTNILDLEASDLKKNINPSSSGNSNLGNNLPIPNGGQSLGGIPKKSKNKPPLPDLAANGYAHSILEKSGTSGQYTTYYPDGSWKQYRGAGKPHGNIPRPNVKESIPNITPNGKVFPGKPKVRPAKLDEIP